MSKSDTRIAVQKNLFPLTKTEKAELKDQLAEIGLRRLARADRYAPVEAQFKKAKAEFKSADGADEAKQHKILAALRSGEKERNVETKVPADSLSIPGGSVPNKGRSHPSPTV